jgi:hypothetical protein
MKFKNLCALFLLSIASVYFICPVQCVAIGEVDEHTPADTTSIYQRHLSEPPSTVEATQSTCCGTEEESTPAHESQEESEPHCCFNRWESLRDSEPQLSTQVQKDTFSSVVLVPATPKVCSIAGSATAHLQLPYNPYTVLLTPQQSPRAPPFSLS